MGRTHRKMLLGIISVLMIALITSTATNTVAAGDWGNLKVGDEMRWKLIYNWDIEEVWYLELEVLEISGAVLTYKYEASMVPGYSTSGIITQNGELKFRSRFVIYSQSRLQELKANAEDDPDETWTFTPHNWEGTNYRTHYRTITRYDGGYHTESWIDRGTGIVLEEKRNVYGYTYTAIELLSTTARLTRARRFCMGTILIAFVSIATLISYSLVKYQKKKKP